MLLPERCLEGCQRDSPPGFARCKKLDSSTEGHSARAEPIYGLPTSVLAAGEEAVALRGWVPLRSDISSGVVMQRSQQWSFRQTWARVPSLVFR